MPLRKLKQEIEDKRVELSKLEEQLAARTITISDIVPFAVFDVFEVCNDIIVLLPLPNGEFAMGGFQRDPAKMWGDKNKRTGENSFTKGELLDKLIRLGALKSTKKFVMVHCEL